jgi:chemotaxis signal transduction protein
MMRVTIAPAAVDAVVVNLGVGRFAIALDQVAEVGKVPAITRVPGVPGWVAGVVNWRGRVLAILDLRQLLGVDAATSGPAARLVVLATDAATVGILVDAIEGTAAFGDGHEPVPAALTGAGAELIRGQVPRDDGPVAVLDVDAVMRLRDALPRCRRPIPETPTYMPSVLRAREKEGGSWTSPSA